MNILIFLISSTFTASQ